MSLDNETIQRIAHLARLAIDAQDIPKYAGELSRILELVEQMDQADTADIQPMAHPLDFSQRLRADIVTEQDQRDAFQAGSPATRDGLFLVPKVIE